jgi:hypothetical protein
MLNDLIGKDNKYYMMKDIIVADFVKKTVGAHLVLNLS